MKKSQHSFKIAHIDPLGQGVSKNGEEIFFVHNTLEGEEGVADVDGQKKGLFFGHLASHEQLTKVSNDRVSPECPHFFECNGCHFLHTSYENEILIKQNNLLRNIDIYMKKTGNKVERNFVFTHQSEKRTATRNRIQLHYDLSKRRLGLIGHKKSKIIKVNQCLIGNEIIQQKIKELYQDERWIKMMPKNAPKLGHIEVISKSNNVVDIVFNHPYSHGGFTQVNQEMNKTLCKIISKSAKSIFVDSDIIFDLFGGSGNLSKEITNKQCIVIDSYGDGMLVDKDGHQEFIRLNLYSQKASNLIKDKIKKYSMPSVILDPPRSGLKNIDDFFPENSIVKNIIYVSCNPATLLRDLIKLKHYKVKQIHLVDLFPCTFHYETVCILEKK